MPEYQSSVRSKAKFVKKIKDDSTYTKGEAKKYDFLLPFIIFSPSRLFLPFIKWVSN